MDRDNKAKLKRRRGTNAPPAMPEHLRNHRPARSGAPTTTGMANQIAVAGSKLFDNFDAYDEGIEVIDRQTYRFRQFLLTSRGFEIGKEIDPEAIKNDMSDLAEQLFSLEGSLQWLIGDWLVYSEDHEWGTTADIAERFGREVETLYDYAGVARGVPFRVRTRNLSFGHYKLVKSMDEKEQGEWLDKAEQGDQQEDGNFKRWSVAKMRAQILTAKRAALPDVERPQLADKRYMREFNSLFRAVERKVKPSPDKIKSLREWLDAIEKE